MTFLLWSVPVLAALTAYAATHTKAWAERGITSLGPWPVVYALQALTAIGGAAYVNTVWGTGPAVAAAAFLWLAALAVSTDLKTRRVPWEVSHLVAPVGLIAFGFNYTTEAMLSFASALVGVVGLASVARWLTNKGLGASDIRILWAATATLSWWIGQTWLLYALIAACLIQLAVRAFAGHFGWGELVPVPTAAHDAASDSQPEHSEVDRTVMRRELPFAPAMIASIVTFVAIGTHHTYGACHMWNVMGAC